MELTLLAQFARDYSLAVTGKISAQSKIWMILLSPAVSSKSARFRWKKNAKQIYFLYELFVKFILDNS